MVISTISNLPPVRNKSQGLISTAPPSQGLISTTTLTTKTAVAIPNYSGDFVGISVPNNPTAIIQSIINGQILTPLTDNRFNTNNLPSVNNPLPSGYFWYDWENQTLYVAPNFNASGLSVLYFTPQVNNIVSTRITDFPDFFYLFNITGTFTITRSFQSHPSATLTITDDYEAKKRQIESYFSKGRDFVIRGIGFRADNPQITVNEQTGMMACVVNFKGKWEGYQNNIDHPIDWPVSESELVGESGRDYYTISQVAAKVGIPFSGSNRKIYVSIPVSNGSTVKLSSLLSNDQFYSEGKVIDWENPARIQVRSWESMPTLVLRDNLPPLEMPSGDKAKYTNAVLTLEKPSRGQGDVYQTITEGRSDYQSPPKTPKNGYYEAFNIQALRTPSWCFDITSEKTPHKTIKQINGFDLEIIEEEWGFVYTSKDVYSISGERYFFDPNNFGSSPDNLWQLVRETTKTYTYNPDTGYFQNVRGLTRRLTRLKQETGELEAIRLQLAINIAEQDGNMEEVAALTKQLTAYTNFFWITEPYNEDYENENLNRYYPELDREDDSKIPNQYVKKFTTGQGAIFPAPNPDSTPDEPLPDVVIGEIKKEDVATNITEPRLKKYKENQTVFTQKGYGLDDSISSSNEVDKNGVPSTATRLQKFGFTEDSEENDGDATLKYLISTDGSSIPFDVENGSIPYSGLKTLSEALKAIRTGLSIQNSQNEKSLVVTTMTPYNVTMGQNIIKNGVNYRLFGYVESFEVTGVVNCKSVGFTLGKYQDVAISYKPVVSG